jgi:hypothetical protein
MRATISVGPPAATGTFYPSAAAMPYLAKGRA